jgi:hypothetical protein
VIAEGDPWGIETRGDYDASIVIWSGRADPDANVSIWVQCDGFINWGQYCNRDLDALFAAARRTVVVAERQVLYRKASAIYLNDRPHLFLYHLKLFWAMSDRVQGFQPAVDDGRENPAIVDGKAAVHCPTTDLRPHRILVHFGIPAPPLSAGARVDGENYAPIRDAVNRVTPDQRRGFLIAAARAGHVAPGQSEAADVGGVDPIQRAESRLALREPVTEPRSGESIPGRAGVPQRVRIYAGRLRHAADSLLRAD